MGTGARVSATVCEGLTKRVGLAGMSKPVSRTASRAVRLERDDWKGEWVFFS